MLAGTAPAHALPLDTSCRVPAAHDPEVTRTVHQVGLSMRVSDKVMLAGFEAGWVESHMNNLSCGDRDSLGVFQQRPSMGWGTPEQIMDVSYAAGRFFERAAKVDRPELTAGLLADAVQRSCCPDRYDLALGRAESMLRQAWQGGPEVVGGRVHVVEDGDVWVDLRRLSSSGEFVGRPSVAGDVVVARTGRGVVMASAGDGAWRRVADGVVGDPEAVLRPDGTVAVYAVLADGSVGVLGMGAGVAEGVWQPVSQPGFAVGKPSAVVHSDGSVSVYVRAGDVLMALGAGMWRQVASGLEGSPEVVLRSDGTVGVYAVHGGRVHRMGMGWEVLGDGRFVDTVAVGLEGVVYARKADGAVVRLGG